MAFQPTQDDIASWRRAYQMALEARADLIKAQAAQLNVAGLQQQNDQTLAKLRAFRDTYFPHEPIPTA